MDFCRMYIGGQPPRWATTNGGRIPRDSVDCSSRNLIGEVGNPNFKPTLTSTTTVPYEGPFHPAVSVTQFDMT